MWKLAFWLALGTAKQADSLTVYDCNHPTQQIQAVDLLEPQSCPDPINDYKDPVNSNVMILQTDSAYPVQAYQCLVVVSRQSTYCGIDSWTGVSEWPTWMKNIPIDPDDCRTAVKNRKFVFEGQEIEFTPGIRTQHTYFSHGEVGTDEDRTNRCKSTSYFRGTKYYQGRYEETHVDITVSQVTGLADLSSGYVTFQNGLRTLYADQVARDAFLGTLVWEKTEPSCEDTISEIYTGSAELHERKTEDETLRDSLVMVKDQKTGQYAGFVLKTTRQTGRTKLIPIHRLQHWQR